MTEFLVTGGSGFIGQRLLYALQQQQHSVCALVRSQQAATLVRKYGATPIFATLADPSSLQHAMAGCTTVFHLAALMDHTQGATALTATNVTGTKHMLTAARAAGVARFIHMSTAAIFSGGPPLINADESYPVPLKPLGLYPDTKARAEQDVLQANTSNFTTLALRPCFVWGSGDTSILPFLLDNVRQRRFTWINGGHHLMSTCHVDNVVAGLLAAAERGQGGEVYFISDDQPIEVRTFFEKILDIYNLDPGTRSVPLWFVLAICHLFELPWRILPLASPAPTHLRTVVSLLGQQSTVSDAKARRELGYQPVVSWDEGLAQMTTQRLE